MSDSVIRSGEHSGDKRPAPLHQQEQPLPQVVGSSKFSGYTINEILAAQDLAGEYTNEK